MLIGSGLLKHLVVILIVTVVVNVLWSDICTALRTLSIQYPIAITYNFFVFCFLFFRDLFVHVHYV